MHLVLVPREHPLIYHPGSHHHNLLHFNPLHNLPLDQAVSHRHLHQTNRRWVHLANLHRYRQKNPRHSRLGSQQSSRSQYQVGSRHQLLPVGHHGSRLGSHLCCLVVSRLVSRQGGRLGSRRLSRLHFLLAGHLDGHRASRP